MKVVLDTNVLIAAFLTSGASRDVLDDVLFRQWCVVSNSILEEFREVLLSKKFLFPAPLVQSFTSYLQRYSTVARESLSGDFDCPDPGDLKILALCHTVKADLLITGDKELLALKKTGVTRILSPAHFWKYAA